MSSIWGTCQEDLEESNVSPEGNWRGAEMYKKYVLEKSPLIEDYLQDERDMINAMEADMLRLRERYKYDSKKQIEIAQDWYDFAKAVHEVKSSREMLDVDMGDNGFEAHGNRTKEPHTIIQEVTKRVEILLGNESAMKAVKYPFC